MSITHGILIRIVRPLGNYVMKPIRRSAAGTNTRVVIDFYLDRNRIKYIWLLSVVYGTGSNDNTKIKY